MIKVLKNKRAKGKGMEMKYNFDEVIDRYDTNSVKYENAKEEEPDLKMILFRCGLQTWILHVLQK